MCDDGGRYGPIGASIGLRVAGEVTILAPVTLDRARESLQAAELCFREALMNSAASRAYYAMFQAAQAALASSGLARAEWSHAGLQAAFATELVHRRKLYPTTFRDYLSVGLGVRHAADYGRAGVSSKIAQRMVRRATAFLGAVEEECRRAGRA